MGIYVEMVIRGTMEEIWSKTQSPDLHQRWDLRFSRIDYLPRPDSSAPQEFLYATRIGLGLEIRGRGETVGRREGEQGERTSALKFWSDDPKSLILVGSGYWRYVPTREGVRFITWYNYRTRFGFMGRVVDSLAFRPLIGWATAWSFDRLRLWIERGIDPAAAASRFLINAVARLTLGFIWIYHGLVPKLIVRHPDELSMLVDTGAPLDLAPRLLPFVGLGEIAVGLVVLLLWRGRWQFAVNIALMLAATVVSWVCSPHMIVAAFNPLTFNIALIALSIAGYLSAVDLPSARNAVRRSREGEL